MKLSEETAEQAVTVATTAFDRAKASPSSKGAAPAATAPSLPPRAGQGVISATDSASTASTSAGRAGGDAAAPPQLSSTDAPEAYTPKLSFREALEAKK